MQSETKIFCNSYKKKAAKKYSISNSESSNSSKLLKIFKYKNLKLEALKPHLNLARRTHNSLYSTC